MNITTWGTRGPKSILFKDDHSNQSTLEVLVYCIQKQNYSEICGTCLMVLLPSTMPDKSGSSLIKRFQTIGSVDVIWFNGHLLVVKKSQTYDSPGNTFQSTTTTTVSMRVSKYKCRNVHYMQKTFGFSVRFQALLLIMEIVVI
uniref:Uncharacterized protein n=1 Tax=Romanomermis culicivorax TaxID=13658 RepID=A0A915HWV9_ROMCU